MENLLFNGLQASCLGTETIYHTLIGNSASGMMSQQLLMQRLSWQRVCNELGIEV